MKNILALIDLSAGAERIAKLALKVAQQSNANLLLFNVFELPVNNDLAFAGHDDVPWQLFEDKPCLTIEELTDKVQHQCYYDTDKTTHQPQINCLTGTDLNTDKLKQLITENHVQMIVTGTPDLLELNASVLMQMINKASCPVLVIPEQCDFNTLDSTAYLTDLRYCDLEVVKFLKSFNTKIFVTHVSASGIPDMDDAYAQSLLSDAIASKVKYNKLFLRNVRGTNRKKDLETVTTTAGIQFFTIVNRKHYLLERFLSGHAETKRVYHNLPLLVMPYPNWCMA
jgi:nucleotide-binding universal stress UspA family protein